MKWFFTIALLVVQLHSAGEVSDIKNISKDRVAPCYTNVLIKQPDTVVNKVKNLFSEEEKPQYQYSYSNVDVLLALDKEKCGKKYPLRVEIQNNSNKNISSMTLNITSWIVRKSGKSYFISRLLHNLQEGKDSDFYVKAKTSYSFCSAAPNEDWSYEVGYGGNIKNELIKTYNVDALEYRVLGEVGHDISLFKQTPRDGCLVSFE